ncbi:MAG: transglycosylase SLT domain-containing protein [Proteobacteria bacterium]|nr:transglycosylase SLT domain-containing protein [Pseudomonadota bacterium]
MRWLALIGMALAGTLVVEPHVAPGRDVRTAGTMQSGVDAHVAGDDAQAIAHLEAWLASESGPWGRERAAGRFLLGTLYLERGDPSLASEQFTKVRAGKGPLEAHASWFEAVADHERGRHKVAAGECKTYRTKWPDGPHADSCLILMGDAYTAAGLRSPAVAAYQQYLDDNPGTPREEEIRIGMALAEANASPARGARALQSLTLDHDYLCTADWAQDELDRILEVHQLDEPDLDPVLADQKRAMSARDGGFDGPAWAAYQAILSENAENEAVQTWGKATWERFCWRTHQYDALGDAFAAQYNHPKTGGSAEDAWFAFRAYFRGGDFQESAKWGEIGLAKHGSHKRWRRSRDVVAHSQQLAGHYDIARDHWDILARTGGSLGRGSEWFAAFSAYRHGDHEDAVKRLDPIVAAGDERELQALYYRGKSKGKLGDTEGARADYRVLLDHHPNSWYSLLLKSKWRKMLDPNARTGIWVEQPAPDDPAVPTRLEPGPVPVVTFGAGDVPPTESFDWTGGAEVPVAPETRIGAASPGASPLPETYVEGRWYVPERQAETFRRFSQKYDRIWPFLPAAEDLASVGLYEIAGEYLADCYDEYQFASGRRTERQKLVRSVAIPKTEWREIFLFVQDHHHVARFTLGLAPSAPDADEWTKAMRLAYPAAHAEHVQTAAREVDLDPLLALGLMRRESLYRSRALSHAGAVGVMQIMPLTGSRVAWLMGDTRYTPAKLEDPATNIRYGTFYLSQLEERFDGCWPQAVAAYNGGPVHVSSWSRSWKGRIDVDDWVEQIPLKETRTYVKGVSENYAVYVKLYAPEDSVVHVPMDLGEDDSEVINF